MCDHLYTSPRENLAAYILVVDCEEDGEGALLCQVGFNGRHSSSEDPPALYHGLAAAAYPATDETRNVNCFR